MNTQSALQQVTFPTSPSALSPLKRHAGPGTGVPKLGSHTPSRDIAPISLDCYQFGLVISAPCSTLTQLLLSLFISISKTVPRSIRSCAVPRLKKPPGSWMRPPPPPPPLKHKFHESSKGLSDSVALLPYTLHPCKPVNCHAHPSWSHHCCSERLCQALCVAFITTERSELGSNLWLSLPIKNRLSERNGRGRKVWGGFI